MLQASSRCRVRVWTGTSLEVSSKGFYEVRGVCPALFKRRFHASGSTSFSALPQPSPTATRNDGGPKPYWKPPPLPKPIFPKRTILIKGWTPLNNMVEVLAVIQAVEEKFGTIVEYVVSKDFEMPEKPFAMIFAAFADPASFKRVPTTGIELAVPAPSYNTKAGGVGWDDIESLLSEVGRDPGYDNKHGFTLSERPGHVQRHIFVRVSAARKEITSNPIPRPDIPSPEMQRQIAEKFLQWTKANKQLRSISPNRIITERELFGVSELDNVRLRAALRWVGKALGKRTCHETHSLQTADVEERKQGSSLASSKDVDDMEGADDPVLIKSTVDK